MPKVIKDDVKCNNCGTCVEVCPTGVFKKKGDVVVIVNMDACVACRACEAQCPTQALRIED